MCFVVVINTYTHLFKALTATATGRTSEAIRIGPFIVVFVAVAVAALIIMSYAQNSVVITNY